VYSLPYRIKVIEDPVCIAHQLHLPYESKCNNLHGHNYRVEVELGSQVLNKEGMVVDFAKVKAVIKAYDHAVIGQVFDADGKPVLFTKHYFQIEPSTAECFAKHIFDRLNILMGDSAPHVEVLSVTCQETGSSEVTCSTGGYTTAYTGA
jgi:6-pyruvoyl tetrahydropterin synthase/QueD family protein